MSSWVLLLVLTLATGGPLSSVGQRAGDDRPLDLSVTPRATHSPGTIRVTDTIDRHQANRNHDRGGIARLLPQQQPQPGRRRRGQDVHEGLRQPAEGTCEIRTTLERNNGARLLDAVTLLVSGLRK